MVHLSDYEIGWLRHRQPQMQYNNETGIWEGLFCFSLQYQNKEVITDEYYIKVDFKSNGDLPLVYDEGRKIARQAILAGRSKLDMHLYNDGHLCMIHHNKMKEWYRRGFKLSKFVKHIETHLYWVSYVTKYGQEPWKAEPHG